MTIEAALRKQSKTVHAESQPGTGSRAIPDVPAPALLSFIKQMSAEPFWDAKHLADICRVKPADVPQITATLEMLGYAEPVPGKKDICRNTQSGNTVSGAKPPRFNRGRVLEALEELRTRAERMNADPASPFRVTELIAFGDFLDEHPKVQAADVGVGLSPKQSDQVMPATAAEHKREEHVLADLKAKSPMLHLQLIEDWMRKRSHQDMIRPH
jgi:hypothetical protein